jgi:rhomboid family GlyGly-CTERM serine protease
MLERLHPSKLAETAALCGLSLLFIGLVLAGPDTTLALRYERGAVLAGQWWRLVTGHLVHADGAHLAWNLAGTWLVGWLFAREFTWRGWLLVLFASTAAIDAGFIAWQPQLEWYVGFSGVLHGCMAAALFAALASTRDSVTILVAVLFAAKLAWEQVAGPLPFTSASIGLPVVHEAHTYGALGGLLGAVALRLARRPQAPSL